MKHEEKERRTERLNEMELRRSVNDITHRKPCSSDLHVGQLTVETASPKRHRRVYSVVQTALGRS